MYMAVSTDPVTSSTALVTFECKAFTGIEKNVKNDVYPINPAHETVPLNPGMALEAPE
jgi:hypothetical protein